MIDQSQLAALQLAIQEFANKVLIRNGFLITAVQQDPNSNELVLTYSNGQQETFGPIRGIDGDPGAPGVSVINVQLITDDLYPDAVFFEAEMSNGVKLRTRDSIAGYHGKSVDNVFLQNGNEFVFVLEDGIELPPIPISGIRSNWIVSTRIDDDGELTFTLNTGEKLKAGAAAGLKGVGVDNVSVSNAGDVFVTYSNSSTPVKVGNILGIADNGVRLINGKLYITYNSGVEVELGSVPGVTGARIVDGELVFSTTIGTDYNAGPVANLKGADGRGVTAARIENNTIIFTLADNSELTPIPVSGLTPVSVTGARWDNQLLELFLQLSTGTEIPTGIKEDITGNGVMSTRLALDGSLYVTYTAQPLTEVKVGVIPAIKTLVLQNGILKAIYNIAPDTPIDLGEVLGINSFNYTPNGLVQAVMSNGTIRDVGILKAVQSFSIQNGNLVARYNDNTTQDIGRVVGPKGEDGISVIGAEVDNLGQLKLLRDKGQPPIAAGQVVRNMTNLIGSIKNFVTQEGQTEYMINHNGEVIIYANGVLVNEGYDLTLSDRVVMIQPTGTVVKIIAFADTGLVITSKGLEEVRREGNNAIFRTESGTEFTLDLRVPVDVTELPPGIKSFRIINGNELEITLTDNVVTNVGPVNNLIGISGATINNDGDLIITRTNGEQINVGSVISNLAISDVKVNAQGNLIVTLNTGSTFDAGPTGVYVVDASINASKRWEFLLSDGRILDGGVAINPVIGHPYDFVCFEGQTEFELDHTDMEVVVYARGICLSKAAIILDDPRKVKLRTPRKLNDPVRIVLLSKGVLRAEHLEGVYSANNGDVYGKHPVTGQPGFFPGNLAKMGIPYTLRPSNGQTILNNIPHSGHVEVFKNGRLLDPLTEYTLPEDNRRIILTQPLTLTDYIYVVVLATPNPTGEFAFTSYAKVTCETYTNGGTFVAGRWETRQLNQIKQNGLNVGLANNRIILHSGRYYVRGWAACNGVRSNILRLRDVTSNRVLLLGPGVQASNRVDQWWAEANSLTPIEGYIDVIAQTQIALEHRCVTTRSQVGFGTVGGGVLANAGISQNDLGFPATLASLELWRVGSV